MKVKGTIRPLQTAALEGSEKQISWATDIRAKAAKVLLQDCILREQYEVQNMMGKPEVRLRPIQPLIEALRSEESIEEYLTSLEDFQVERAIESMNAALDRYARYVEIMSNPSAKFWIDNRDNKAKNYMFKAFKEYINTGIKKF